MMKARFIRTPGLAASLLCGALLSAPGCAGGPHARTGTAVGGLTGGALGAVAGAHSKNALGGAAIGALAGSVLGGALGDAADRDESRWAAQQASYEQAARSNAVSIGQVIEMTRSGLGDQVIANQIRNQGVVAPLSTTDLVTLKQNGVSDVVIAAWQEAPGPRIPAVVQPVPVRPVIVHDWCPSPWYDPHCDFWHPPHHWHGHHHGTALHVEF
jgi:hypothetical protein